MTVFDAVNKDKIASADRNKNLFASTFIKVLLADEVDHNGYRHFIIMGRGV
jgi:hypothetical protein